MAPWRRTTRGATFLCGVACLLTMARPVEPTCDVDALFVNADSMTNATVEATRAWRPAIGVMFMAAIAIAPRASF